MASQAERDAHKLMRRGTRACRECTKIDYRWPIEAHANNVSGRRRKIRCIYDNDEAEICQECTAHNRDCVKQGIVRGSTSSSSSSRSVKVQVTRLESAVEKLARDKTRKADARIPRQPRRSSQALVTSPADLDETKLVLDSKSPIFSLFDNDLV